MVSIKLSEILDIYKESELDDFLKKVNKFTLNEKSLTFNKIKENWKFLGGTESNCSPVNILPIGEKGLIERITNGVDAVIEKQKNKLHIGSAKDSSVIISKAFPKFYENMQAVFNNTSNQLSVKDAADQVVVAVNEGSKSNKPTIDVVDKGTGIKGENFETTILSLHHGNKLSSDKTYQIGAFGQGGSTALPFSYATIVVSKIDNKYYITIIKQANLDEIKNYTYVFLCDDEGKIIELENDIEPSPVLSTDDYIQSFLNSESGTLVRMIEMDITKKFRDNEVTKPGMLIDYINTELFNVGLPVKVIDKRKNYAENKHTQNRYAHGTLCKLQTSKYLQKDYCGTLKLVHNDTQFTVDYYVLLPKDENEWGSESKCKVVFEQFNVTLDPILYIVNGQTITTEKFTKLSNAGLTYLKYRLLAVINLDVIGSMKYKFINSNRSQMQFTDLTRGFFDKVVSELSNVDKLKEINNIIAEKSINSTIDKQLLEDVTKEVKGQYQKLLKAGNLIFADHRGHRYEPMDEEIFEDHLITLDITSNKREFFIDQAINFVTTTKAQKHINDESQIYVFIDNKPYYDFTKNSMNGRISFVINPGKIEPGDHTIQFCYYGENNDQNLQSSIEAFKVLNEKSPETTKKEAAKNLDLNIVIRDDSSLICDIAQNKQEKSITVYLCLDTDDLKAEVYGMQKSTDEIATIKTKLIKPIALFALLYSDYENLDTDEKKNKLIINVIKTFLISNNSI